MLDALKQALLAWLSTIPFSFGPAEFLCLIVLMLTMVIVLAPGPVRRSWAMAVLGLLLGCIWNTDVETGILRGLWDFYLNDDMPLVQALVVYGFLLPCVAAYASQAVSPQLRVTHQAAQPNANFHNAWRTIYNGLLMPHTLPALLLMRQPWLPARWVLPVLAFGVAALGLYWDVSPIQYPVWCLFVLLAGLCAQWLDLPWPPLLAGLITQEMIETNLRRSLLLSEGDWSVYLQRPISAILLLLTLLIVSASLIMRAQLRRASSA